MIRYMHKINAMDLRNFCVDHNLFTCGDNKSYDKLFEDAKGDVDALHLEYVVDRIYANSNLDDIQGFDDDTFCPETIATYLIAENVLQTLICFIDD